MFSIFDTSGKIQHYPHTDGETNQVTGTWDPPETASAVEIEGDVQDLTYRDLQRLPEGEYQIGDRRIFTYAVLADKDILKITEDDGTVTSWMVKNQEDKSTLLAQYVGATRKTYLLKRR